MCLAERRHTSRVPVVRPVRSGGGCVYALLEHAQTHSSLAEVTAEGGEVEDGSAEPVEVGDDELLVGWTKTFADPRRCAALVDRLTLGVEEGWCRSWR
ncbi:hypothetical protein ABMA10_20505 [Plantibacter sp. RU18]